MRKIQSHEAFQQDTTFDQAHMTVERLTREVNRGVVISPELTLGALGGFVLGGFIGEGGVGTGKTKLANTIATASGYDFKRVSGTPDVEVKDITGLYIYNPDTREFEFFKGPAFADLLFVDEINRIATKPQAALLEAMEEKKITTNRSEVFELSDAFTVIATHNPNAIAQGVSPLVEAQLDRFPVAIKMPPHDARARKAVVAKKRLNIDPQQVVSAADILNLRKVVEEIMIDDSYEDALNDMLDAGQKHPYVNPETSLLSSGRPLQQGLALAAFSALSDRRLNVTPADIRFAARNVFPHRMVVNYEGREARRTGYDIANEIAERAIIAEKDES